MGLGDDDVEFGVLVPQSFGYDGVAVDALAGGVGEEASGC
jgi:hypothetical protein